MSIQANNQNTSGNSVPLSISGAHSQENPTSFTTTDASGYPDKHDGLVAHSPPTVIQDPHEHHKHNQVQDEPLTTGAKDNHAHPEGEHHHSHNPFYKLLHQEHKDHGHGEKPVLGHSSGGHLHNHKSPVGDTFTEIHEELQDPTMRVNDTPRQVTVPSYLR